MKGKMIIRRMWLVLLLGVAITSCTQNDGYIGPIFGKWQLIEMWEDGTMTPHDSIYYNFQTSVIQIQLVHRNGIEGWSDKYYGSFVKENDELRFNITEPKPLNPEKPELPAVFKLEPMGKEHVNVFHIETLNSSRMVLTRGDNECFVFRKF